MVADPVHFRPDPDPTNQNFEIRILQALTKNQFKHQIFFINQTSSDIFKLIFLLSFLEL